MNIEFKETMPQGDKEEDIILNGEKIGKVTTYGGDRYTHKCHSNINIRGGHLGLIQGWGDTKEEAIKDALATGRAEAERELISIAELEQRLGLRS